MFVDQRKAKSPGLADLNHLDLNRDLNRDLNQLIFFIKISDLNQNFVFS